MRNGLSRRIEYVLELAEFEKSILLVDPLSQKIPQDSFVHRVRVGTPGDPS